MSTDALAAGGYEPDATNDLPAVDDPAITAPADPYTEYDSANNDPSGYGPDKDAPADAEFDPVIVFHDTLVDVGEVLLLDGDGDGIADFAVIDIDHDGVPDAELLRTDTGFVLWIDADGDGVVDEVELTAEDLREGVPELYDAMTSVYTPEVPGAELVIDNGVILGDPFRYGEEWFQQTFNGACLPAATTIIIADYLGREITEAEIVELVNELGGWVVGPDGIPGTYPETMVELLDHYGIGAELSTNATLGDLQQALDNGYAIGVAVDSGYIWDIEAEKGIPVMDHMLLVTGIDLETGAVYLSDTGTGDGAVTVVPLTDFLAAWAGSDNTIVVSDVTVEDFQVAQGIVADAELDHSGRSVPVGAGPAPGETASDTSVLLDTSTPPLEGVLKVLTANRWMIVPVLLGAGVAIRSVLDRDRN